MFSVILFFFLPFNLNALYKPRASCWVSAASSTWLTGLAVYQWALVFRDDGSWFSVCDEQNWEWLRNAKPLESGSQHSRLIWGQHQAGSFLEFQSRRQEGTLLYSFLHLLNSAFLLVLFRKGGNTDISDFHFLFPFIPRA